MRVPCPVWATCIGRGVPSDAMAAGLPAGQIGWNGLAFRYTLTAARSAGDEEEVHRGKTDEP